MDWPNGKADFYYEMPESRYDGLVHHDDVNKMLIKVLSEAKDKNILSYPAGWP